MKTLALKEKGLMEILLRKETETIAQTVAKTGTEQIPHWVSDNSVKGCMRFTESPELMSVKDVTGHQRPY